MVKKFIMVGGLIDFIWRHSEGFQALCLEMVLLSLQMCSLLKVSLCCH